MAASSLSAHHGGEDARVKDAIRVMELRTELLTKEPGLLRSFMVLAESRRIESRIAGGHEQANPNASTEKRFRHELRTEIRRINSANTGVIYVPSAEGVRFAFSDMKLPTTPKIVRMAESAINDGVPAERATQIAVSEIRRLRRPLIHTSPLAPSGARMQTANYVDRVLRLGILDAEREKAHERFARRVQKRFV